MSAILGAECLKQSAILEAEGQKMAQALRAEGFASALEEIFKSAKNVDANTMLIQYLEALKSIGASPATKYIFPMEFTGLIRPLAEMMTSGSNGRHQEVRPPGA